MFSAYAERVNPEQDLYHDIYTVQAIDGSVVDVAARLIRTWAGLPGRGGGPSRKAQAKIHTLFNVTFAREEAGEAKSGPTPPTLSATSAPLSIRRAARRLRL